MTQTQMFDLGLTFSGRQSGNTVESWAQPQPYTPPVDDNYIPGPWIGVFVSTLLHTDPVFVFGPTGSGKTAGIKFVAGKLNMPVYEVTGHSRLEFPELVGGYHVQDGNMVWHDGPLTAAMRNGGVLLVNEMDLLDPSTAAGLNSVLDGSPLFIPETNEYVQRHRLFRFVATANSNGSGDATGMYQGVLRQNMALMSRFTVIEAAYLRPELEKMIIQRKVSGLPEDIVERMLDFAQVVRESFIGNPKRKSDAATMSVTMSPRDLIRWGRLMVQYQNLSASGVDVVWYALQHAFALRADTPTQQALAELKQRIFPPLPSSKGAAV